MKVGWNSIIILLFYLCIKSWRAQSQNNETQPYEIIQRQTPIVNHYKVAGFDEAANLRSTRSYYRSYVKADDEEEPQNKIVDAVVHCDLYRNTMKVEFRFNEGFNGYTYTKGYYQISECKALGDGVNHLTFEFPLDGCGTTIRSQGSYGNSKVWYQNTVIIMYETYLGILESYDRSFDLRCELDDKIKKVSSSVTVPMLISKAIDYKFEMPDIWMKLVSGKDPSAPPAPYLTIGEIGTMVIIMEKQSNRFDFFAFQCSAHDGSGKSQVILLNDLGCPVHRKLVGPQQFDKLKSQEMITYAHFKVFKFPDVENVYIECYVKLCFQKCPKEKCWIIRDAREHARVKRHSPYINSSNFTDAFDKGFDVKTYQSVSVVFPTPESEILESDSTKLFAPDSTFENDNFTFYGHDERPITYKLQNNEKKLQIISAQDNLTEHKELASKKICISFIPFVLISLVHLLVFLCSLFTVIILVKKCVKQQAKSSRLITITPRNSFQKPPLKIQEIQRVNVPESYQTSMNTSLCSCSNVSSESTLNETTSIKRGGSFVKPLKTISQCLSQPIHSVSPITNS